MLSLWDGHLSQAGRTISEPASLGLGGLGAAFNPGWALSHKFYRCVSRRVGTCGDVSEVIADVLIAVGFLCSVAALLYLLAWLEPRPSGVEAGGKATRYGRALEPRGRPTSRVPSGR